MNKDCPICDYPLRDGDDVVAIMVAKFKMIPSDTAFAVEHPTRCIEVVHSECFDYEDYEHEEHDDE